MAKQLGINPFTAADIKSAQSIADVGDQMLGFLERCDRCKFPVAHLVSNVKDIVERMKMIVTEFGHDTTE